MSLLSAHKSLARASVLALFLGVGVGAGTGGAAGADAPTPAAVNCSGLDAVTAVSYTGVRADGTPVDYGKQDLGAKIATDAGERSDRNLNYGVLSTSNKIQPGDTVTATFTRSEGCEATQIGIATYRTMTSVFEADSYADFLAGQQLHDSATTETGNTLTVKVPAVAGGTDGCTNKHLDTDRTFNGNGGDSASGNQYASTCDGSASQNGNGNGNATGRDCAGCRGNADNKNPKGQFPNGTDANNGYECDGNNGVAKGNPAHSGCGAADFQFDLFTGPVLTTLSVTNDYFGTLGDGSNGPSISYTWKYRTFN